MTTPRLFEPLTLGPLTLRNRTIRAAKLLLCNMLSQLLALPVDGPLQLGTSLLRLPKLGLQTFPTRLCVLSLF